MQVNVTEGLKEKFGSEGSPVISSQIFIKRHKLFLQVLIIIVFRQHQVRQIFIAVPSVVLIKWQVLDRSDVLKGKVLIFGNVFDDAPDRKQPVVLKMKNLAHWILISEIFPREAFGKDDGIRLLQCLLSIAGNQRERKNIEYMLIGKQSCLEKDP